MSTFAELVEDGAVRHLGASNFPAWRIARANRIAAERDWPRFECVQPRFSYMIPDRDADFDAQLPTTDELVDYCDQADLSVLPYSPTLQGCYGRDDRSIPEGYVRTENRLKMRLVSNSRNERASTATLSPSPGWSAVTSRRSPSSAVAPSNSSTRTSPPSTSPSPTKSSADSTPSERYGFDEWDLREA